MSGVRLSYWDQFVISPCNDLLIYPRSKKEPIETLPSEILFAKFSNQEFWNLESNFLRHTISVVEILEYSVKLSKTVGNLSAP